ncbi:unnamed protein product [Closterium sp. NIES-53]
MTKLTMLLQLSSKEVTQSDVIRSVLQSVLLLLVCAARPSTTLTPLPAPVPVKLADPSGGPVLARSSNVLLCPAVPSGGSVRLTVRSSPPLVFDELGEYSCPPGCDGHYHHSWGSACVDLHVYTDGPSPGHVHPSAWVESIPTDYRASSGSCVCLGVRVKSGSAPLLVSPPVALDSPVAPPPWSPLPATPSWPAILPPCFWSSQVSASPPALACPALLSLRRGAVARRSSLLLVSSDDCSPADSPHGSLPRVSLPETSPTLRWTGKVGDASVSGSGALVPLSAILPQTSSPPALFLVSSLAFPLMRLAGSFTTPPCAVSSRLRTSLLGTVPVEVAVDLGASRGVASGGAASGGAEPEGAESGGAELGGAEPGVAEPGGAEPGGAESEGVEPGGTEPGGAELGHAEPGGAKS